MIKQCLTCNKTFTVTGRNQQYCTFTCQYYSAKARSLRDQRMFKSIDKPVPLAKRCKRHCLSCGKNFASEGNFNRVCKQCKGGWEYGGKEVETYSAKGTYWRA